MEMPEQKMPVLFSQMLQMFPNVPRDIIWMYVQRYSSDIEKCAQMLNLQSGKYTGLKPLSSLDNGKDLSEYIWIQPSNIMPLSKCAFDNNNEVHVYDKLLINNDSEKSTAENAKDRQEIANSTMNSSPNIVHQTVVPPDCFGNLNGSYKFHQPLELHINVDNDDKDDNGSSHNWRPSLSADALCSDFFLPSPMPEKLYSDRISNWNIQQNVSEILTHSESVGQKPVQIYYGYSPQNERAYRIDIASHLHYQKSRMNTIRYEVIKAKIEVNDLKEAEEKLQSELKEKMQSKSVQDIEKLNEEIVQLRLECQCLCTEVDSSLNDQVLLGEVDESYYRKTNASHSPDIPNPVSSPFPHPESPKCRILQDEPNRWECSKCTFANHPAITVCEMCHVPRPSNHSPLFLDAVPTSCYCHPKEKSLPVQS